METAAEKSAAVFGFTMRKKWLWLLVLPILLCGAIFWARDAAWKKQKLAFRFAVRQWVEAHDIRHVGVMVTYSISRREVNGEWNSTEFLAMLEDVHLRRAQPNPPYEADLTIGFPDPAKEGVAGPADSRGFGIDMERDRGIIDLSNQNSSEHWEKFELTPETCRMIKKRIFALKEKGGELLTPK